MLENMQPIKTFPEPYTSSHYEKVLMYMYILLWVHYLQISTCTAIQYSLPQSLWNQVAPGTLWNMRNSSSALVSLCVHGVDLDAELSLLALDSSSG